MEFLGTLVGVVILILIFVPGPFLYYLVVRALLKYLRKP